MLELIIFSTLNGLLYGMLLFLLASGLTLIFSMMGVLNFAHASFYMVGAYFGYQISRYVGYWPGLVLAPLLVGLIGALVERYGLRTVHKHGHVAELLFTFGLAFMIEELVQMIWGKIPVDYRVLKDGARWRIYDIVIEGVSLVNNYRSQFAGILQKSSYPELVRRLKSTIQQQEKG